MSGELGRLKADLRRHLDNEMELVRRIEALKPTLSEEQHAELLQSMLGHPHAETARAMFSDLENVGDFLEMLLQKRIRVEAVEEPARKTALNDPRENSIEADR